MRTHRSIRNAGMWLTILLVASAPEAATQTPLLSPRDSADILLDSQRVVIDYGRPSMRGRTIMGGLVPFNKWWRTGANEATSFKTEADLMLADSLIPAGAYTLYTLPSETRWKLIINKQTGQWGTVYNPDMDLVRLPMTKRTLKTPVEAFTILLDQTGPASGSLLMRWERTEVSVPFHLRDTTAVRAQKGRP